MLYLVSEYAPNGEIFGKYLEYNILNYHLQKHQWVLHANNYKLCHLWPGRHYPFWLFNFYLVTHSNFLCTLNVIILRIHRTTWPHVRRPGKKKVPPDGCSCRILPFKVVIIIIILHFRFCQQCFQVLCSLKIIFELFTSDRLKPSLCVASRTWSKLRSMRILCVCVCVGRGGYNVYSTFIDNHNITELSWQVNDISDSIWKTILFVDAFIDLPLDESLRDSHGQE